jgi:nucleoside phosphorylase
VSKYEISGNGVIGAVGDRATGTVHVGSRESGTAGAGPAGPTVGIVAALPEEHVPMEALLLGARREDVAGDRAAYRRGALPSRDPARAHQVVLTLSGDTGNSPAADACTNLLRSFPSVGYVLMVGIAAGVPQAGVRRGDVVVSTGGIVDYDHVREYPDHVELRRPFPRPSPLLVRAAKELLMEEIGGGRAWTDGLPAGPAGYQRPDGDRTAVPRVHHGQIGSADRSLRNETVRDDLVRRHRELIAFEMEGAGLGSSSALNGREYLVVRGVSDLGEGGRDATWRKYAAYVAAGYARALLARCVPVTPQGGLPT